MENTKQLSIITVTFIILISCQQSYAIDDSNLVAHWEFDEGAGTTAYDSAGNNDGTIYDAQWTEGKIGGALYFDGVNDYVEIPDDNSLRPEYITMSAWIEPETMKHHMMILCKSTYSDASGEQYALGLWSGVTPHCGIKRNSGCVKWINWYRVFGETLTDDENWYLITTTWDGNIIKMYVNGELEGINDTVPEGPIDDCEGGTVRIGLWWLEDPQRFNGSIDDVRIYNKALTDEEVSQLYLEGISIPVSVDIKPASCPNPLNLKSRGVLPIAILGSDDFDVNSIDLTSIRLAGVPPVRSSFEDVATPVSDSNECACTTEGPDGFTDLVLKFRTPEIAMAIVDSYGTINKGDVIPLTLTATLSSDRLIIGSDCVIIVGKVPRELTAMRSDVNKDGIINFFDFTWIAEYWLEPAFIE